MSSASNTLTTCEVAGRPLGVWDTLAGTESSVEVPSHRAGGGVQESYASRKKNHSDATVTRTYARGRDVGELEKWLRANLGKPGSVNEQPLDDDDIAFGAPTTRTGRLKSVATGDADSDSEDRRVITLVFSVDEVV
jgi:hypothetical protein